MTGNGTPTELQGPLARLWRDVYAKAAGVAEGRTVQLLKEHVYHYPHGAGGGGGGGGALVLLAERTVTTAGGESAVRLPASGSLAPTGYASLVLLWRARIGDGTGTTLGLHLRLNDDTASNYRYVQHAARSDAAHTVEGTTTGFTSQPRFYAARVPGTDAAAGAAAAGTVTLPGAGSAAFWQALLSESVNAYDGTVDTQVLQHGGAWMQAAAVTSVTCLGRSSSADRSFDVGSAFALYGVFPAGAGGGGGGADVTITTDASLSATESPANTFALAVRLSADAGNALALRANGLYATDTGGGGGTGNTTMYTQTSAPTGATNSLWFNPGESA